MKIAVITPRYAISGVPLAQTKFARVLASHGHDVELVFGRTDAGLPVPSIPGAKVTVLDRPNVRSMLPPIWRYLRAERPDIVFSAEDHLNVVVSLSAILSMSDVKISGSSRVTPFDTYSDKIFSKRWFLKQIAKAVLWRANVLTCVSKDMVGQYRQVFKSSRHVCVYNIVVDGQARSRMDEPVSHKWLNDKTIPVVIAAGRLEPWKGFADLIKAVGILNRTREARLIILGEGPLRDELEGLVSSLGLADVVDLHGFVSNPLAYFAKADVFALSSLVEGLPNVLVEAMMCGCTPVSTNCPTGPMEVLKGGEYGYLVPMRDPAAMASALGQALDNPIPAVRLAEAIRPFEQSAVLKEHFKMLNVPVSSAAA